MPSTLRSVRITFELEADTVAECLPSLLDAAEGAVIRLGPTLTLGALAMVQARLHGLDLEADAQAALARPFQG